MGLSVVLCFSSINLSVHGIYLFMWNAWQNIWLVINPLGKQLHGFSNEVRTKWFWNFQNLQKWIEAWPTLNSVQGIRNGIGHHFEMWVHMCLPGSLLASCKISRNVIQIWLKTGYSKLILSHPYNKNGYIFQHYWQESKITKPGEQLGNFSP